MERSRISGGFNAKITCQSTLNIYRSFDVSFISKSAGHCAVSIFHHEALWLFSQELELKAKKQNNQTYNHFAINITPGDSFPVDVTFHY